MGGKTQQASSQVTIPPEVLARYNSVNAQAQQTAATPFQQYSSDPNAFVSPMTTAQNMGLQQTANYANAAQPGLQTAMGMTQGAMGQANPWELTGDKINQYTNPYTQNVTNQMGALMNQQANLSQSTQMGNAIKSGAFGGDRAGVAAANLQGQNALAYGNAMAPVLQQGYNTGLQTAIGQQGVDLGAQQANLQRMMTGANQYGQLAGAGQQAGLAGAQAMMGAGQVQQQTQQAGLTALYNQFQQQQSYPFQVNQFLANIAEGTGSLSGQTTNSTQSAPMFSDRDLKENIKHVGTAKNGLPIHSFNYKGDPAKLTRLGFMADEVEKKHPEAVGLAGGYKTVDYDRAARASGGGTVTDYDHGQGFDLGGFASMYDPSWQGIGQRHLAGLQSPQQGSSLYGSKRRHVPETSGARFSLPNAPVPPKAPEPVLAQLASTAGQVASLGSTLGDAKEKYFPGKSKPAPAPNTPTAAPGAPPPAAAPGAPVAAAPGEPGKEEHITSSRGGRRGLAEGGPPVPAVAVASSQGLAAPGVRDVVTPTAEYQEGLGKAQDAQVRANAIQDADRAEAARSPISFKPDWDYPGLGATDLQRSAKVYGAGSLNGYYDPTHGGSILGFKRGGLAEGGQGGQGGQGGNSDVLKTPDPNATQDTTQLNIPDKASPYKMQAPPSTGLGKGKSGAGQALGAVKQIAGLASLIPGVGAVTGPIGAIAGAGESLAGACGGLMVAGGRRRRRREDGGKLLSGAPAAEPGLLDRLGGIFSPDRQEDAQDTMQPPRGKNDPPQEGFFSPHEIAPAGTGLAPDPNLPVNTLPANQFTPEDRFAHLPQATDQAPKPAAAAEPAAAPTPPPRPGSVDLPRKNAPVPTPRPAGLTPATDANGNPIDQFFGAIGKGLGQIGTDIGHGLDAFGNFLTGIPESVSKGLSGAGDTAQNAVKGAGEGVEHITGGLGNAARGAVEGVKGAAQSANEAITGAGQNIGNFIDRSVGAQKAGIPYFGNFSESGPQGIVFHHTGGRGTSEGVINTLAQRGLASNYVMERDGTVVQILPNGQRGAHMRDSDDPKFKAAVAHGLSNRNTLGIEMIAKDNNDLTDAQKASAVKFANAMRQQYNNPNMAVYGHGELNPGHKQATEGMGAVEAIRAADQASPGPQGPTVPSPKGLAPTVQDTAPGTGLAGGQQASDARTTFAMARGRPHSEAYQHGIQGILGREEAFRDKVYWDKGGPGGGHWAIGYGTHMIPGADGKMRDVVPGDTITPEASYATLRQRVMTEFVPRAKKAVGTEAWGALPPRAQDALAATVYNYGHMPPTLIGPIKAGNLQAIAAALRGLGGSKLARERRDREAQLIESGRVR